MPRIGHKVSLEKYVDTPLQSAVAAAAGYAEAYRLVPVDTGRLRASIRVKIDDDGFELSADTPYAAFVEYGTIRQRAQPYLRPGFDAALRVLEATYGGTIRTSEV